MKVEIWSDYMCPFCYIGKRHYDTALEAFPHRDQVETIWRSFQLNPDAEVETQGDLHDYLASKFRTSREQAKALNDQMVERAAQSGLQYDLDAASPTNSLDAHRLTHLAAHHDKGDQAEERLLAAHFTEGQHLGRHETLKKLAAEIGLDAAEVETMLTGDAYTDEVQADQQLAREFGITGVPFFVIDRKYGISGAQPVDVFSQALTQAWEEHKPVFKTIASGDACEDESCAIPQREPVKQSA